MADTPALPAPAAKAGGKLLSKLEPFLIGNNQITVLSFSGYLSSAIVVDIVLADWLPGAGTGFVTFCYGMYWLNGYKTDKMLTTTVVTAILGFIPIVADFTNIAFVVITYGINAVETRVGIAATRFALQKARGYLTKSAANAVTAHGGTPKTQGGTSAHDTLGISRDASQKEATAARRRLAQQYHPDAPGGGDLEKMKEINAAYDQFKTGSAPAPQTPAAPNVDGIRSPGVRQGVVLDAASRFRRPQQTQTEDTDQGYRQAA